MMAHKLTLISRSFRGSRQTSRYSVANEAAINAGNRSAFLGARRHWNLHDFDVAQAEFHRVLDNLTLGMPSEGEVAS
jgi:hypothetical protein